MALIGSIVAFAGPASLIPEADGWMLCDGRALARSQYPALFAAIATHYGVGDGVNTFNIPDLRGYFLRGVSGSTGVDPGAARRSAAGGNAPNEVGSVQGWATAMPAGGFKIGPVGDHAHGDPTWNGQAGPYEVATQNSGGSCRGPGGVDYGAQSAPTTAAGGHAHAITGGDPETRPVNKYVHWVIVAR